MSIDDDIFGDVVKKKYIYIVEKKNKKMKRKSYKKNLKARLHSDHRVMEFNDGWDGGMKETKKYIKKAMNWLCLCTNIAKAKATVSHIVRVSSKNINNRGKMYKKKMAKTELE